MSDPHFLATPAGRRLAHHRRVGRGPTVIFLPGYMSDMEGSKALALDSWCEGQGRAFLRFDYGGCGVSPGHFEDQGLADWREDAVAMIDSVEGPVILVGSSMGGWIMLLAALARPERIAGLIGIAAAPDFTDWGFSASDKATIARDGRLVEETPYGEQSYVTTRIFWDSGESLKLLGAEIPIDAPVRLLHGQADPDVPFDISLRIAERLRSADVQTILVKDGDHRLSRPQDIVLLTATLSQLLEA
ncbi:MAG: alpha/beta fold hydrolase [Allosphingosinicella sp.]|uniref:alpha/beta fold hydrolase n=1 Tax=Allosphingosinicella sp. TaxID=2823234 RepID=UPI0039634087